MDSRFIDLPFGRVSGKIAQRVASDAARSRLAKQPYYGGHGVLRTRLARGFFMATPQQLAQHIQDTDAVWALEDFERTPFTDRIAAALQAGEMTMEQAIQELQKDLLARTVNTRAA